MKFEVTMVETLGDKIRVKAQECAGPGTRAALTVLLELPLHRSRAFYLGRRFKLAVKPVGGGS